MDSARASRLTAMIADDHAIYRAGLSMILRESFARSEEASDFDTALDLLAADSFDLAIFDLDMPGMTGAQTLIEVRATYPHMALVVLSSFTDNETITTALATGIDAYITKTTAPADMLEILRQVLRKRQTVPPAPCSAKADMPVQVGTFSDALTARQRDVLSCVEQGLSNKEIARSLNIAPGTVKIHLAALFSHFGSRNRTELAIKTRRDR